MAAAAGAIQVLDNLLPADAQRAVLGFLRQPGWAWGAYSDPAPGASRYWYKHFAGVRRDGEGVDPDAAEAQLGAAPLLASFWQALKGGPLAGHGLTRCYANAYPAGTEGGVHRDAVDVGHYTSIYYPHLAWSPNWAGETVFFDDAEQDIVAAVYPRPNRLAIFPGTIPHVGRAASRACPELRVTLMFKTYVGGR